MANKPLATSSRAARNNVLLVDEGTPVVSHTVPIKTLGVPAHSHVLIDGVPAMVLSREVDTVQDLKQGRGALVPRTAGIARLDGCLAYRDERGHFHYFYEGKYEEPTLVAAEWDIGLAWQAPGKPDPGEPSISLVKRKWDLDRPSNPNMNLILEFPSNDDMELVEDVWNLR